MVEKNRVKKEYTKTQRREEIMRRRRKLYDYTQVFCIARAIADQTPRPRQHRKPMLSARGNKKIIR